MEAALLFQPLRRRPAELLMRLFSSGMPSLPALSGPHLSHGQQLQLGQLLEPEPGLGPALEPTLELEPALEPEIAGRRQVK